MGPSVSEGAIIQHLAKLRNRMPEFKLPPLRRGGAPAQYAKAPEIINDNEKRATRTKKQAEEMEKIANDHGTIGAGDYEDDSEFIDDDAGAESEEDNNHVRKKAKTTGEARRAKNASTRVGNPNTREKGPEDEYIETASHNGDDISEANPGTDGDNPKSSSQGSPVAMDADFLNFNSPVVNMQNAESLNSFQIGDYQETRKLVKLPVSTIGDRVPEDITPRNTGTGEVSRIFEGGPIDAVNQLGFVHGQHDVTGASNYGFQVVSGPATQCTPYTESFQGINMGGLKVSNGISNPIAPLSQNMPYSHHDQHGKNNGGVGEFAPFVLSNTYGQPYGIGIGSSSDRIQGIHGTTSQASYGSQNVSTDMCNDPVLGGTISGLGSLNAYSPLAGSFFSEATHNKNSMAMSDSVNPNQLDGASLQFGQESNNDLQSPFFGFSLDPSQKLSNETENTQRIPDVDKSELLDYYSNFF